MENSKIKVLIVSDVDDADSPNITSIGDEYIVHVITGDMYFKDCFHSFRHDEKPPDVVLTTFDLFVEQKTTGLLKKRGVGPMIILESLYKNTKYMGLIHKCKNNKGVNATTMLFLGAYGDKSAGCDHRKKIGNNQYIVAHSGDDFYPDNPNWKKLFDCVLHNYCYLYNCEEKGGGNV